MEMVFAWQWLKSRVNFQSDRGEGVVSTAVVMVGLVVAAVFLTGAVIAFVHTEAGQLKDPNGQQQQNP
jgi:hypothetical protein